MLAHWPSSAIATEKMHKNSAHAQIAKKASAAKHYPHKNKDTLSTHRAKERVNERVVDCREYRRAASRRRLLFWEQSDVSAAKK